MNAKNICSAVPIFFLSLHTFLSGCCRAVYLYLTFDSSGLVHFLEHLIL
jgi:hypothetical protein